MSPNSPNNTTTTVLGPDEDLAGTLAATGVRMMVRSKQTEGGFSLVQHRIAPHSMTSPVHRHSREDEYTVVQSGRVAAMVGDEVVYAETGAMIFKPRGQWHAVWNPDDAPARILEIITPGGMEDLFELMPKLLAEAGSAAESVCSAGRSRLRDRIRSRCHRRDRTDTRCGIRHRKSLTDCQHLPIEGKFMLVLTGAEDLSANLNQELGVSDWHDVTQESIDEFARVTGDDQWIHVDVGSREGVAVRRNHRARQLHALTRPQVLVRNVLARRFCVCSQLRIRQGQVACLRFRSALVSACARR